MKTSHFLICLTLALLASACSTIQNSAPVVDRSVGTRETDTSKPVATRTAPKTAADAAAYYTVKKGDTLFRIALDAGQSYSDLVTWNNLANPNDIKVGQALRIAPPDSIAPSGGVQTGAVATSSGVEVRAITPPPVSSNPVINSTPSGSTVSSNSSQQKTAPRGDKRAYSESAFAELQKTESGNTAVLSSRPEVAKPSEKVAEKAAEKSIEKPAEPTSNPAATDEQAVAWIWPADGKVIAGFDESKKGIDIAGKPGQQIVAAGAGKVMYAGSGIRGYGNLVIVKHSNSLLSAYAHNKSIMVKEGQTVARGQKIAEMGNSDTDAVKLHFEIRQQGKPVDPSKFLPTR